MRRLIVLLILAVGCAATAQSFSFEPITRDFAPSGQSASHVFRVRNTTSERIAVQVSVRPRRIEPDGTEIQGKESELFTIFPRQMLLAPDEQRSVRVRWNGPADIETEQAFRIIAEQLPVDFGTDQPAEGASIRLTYRYEGTVYVVPPNARPEIRVRSTSTLIDGGRRFLRFEIENSGTRHALLQGLKLSLRSQEQGEVRLVLEEDDLQGIAGENMLARSVRTFTVPAPGTLWSGDVFADLEYGAE